MEPSGPGTIREMPSIVSYESPNDIYMNFFDKK